MRSQGKTPWLFPTKGLQNKCLAVTYFHMGRPHTIIGAERFHFRVRDGIGWFPLAIAARQTGGEEGVPSSRVRNVVKD